MPTERSGTQRRSSSTPGEIARLTSGGRCSSCQRRTESASASSDSVGRPAPGSARAGSASSRRSDHSRRAASPRSRTSRTMRSTSLMPSIRSTGRSRIDEPPAASSSGSKRQTSAAGTSACTATMPGSVSGRTLGAREPGTIAQIASSAAFGRVQHQVPRRARLDDAAQDSWPDCERGRRSVRPRDQGCLGREQHAERAEPVRPQCVAARDEVDDRIGQLEPRRYLDGTGDLHELDLDTVLAQSRARKLRIDRRRP